MPATTLRVMCTPANASAALPTKKLLVPVDFTISDLIAVIRRGLGAEASTSITLTVDGTGTRPADSEAVKALHSAHADAQGILHVVYAPKRKVAPLATMLEGKGPVAAPHPVPNGEGADISSCTFLNAGGRAGGSADHASARPSNGGVVPIFLYFAVVLDMCAVGLVIPLLPRYTRLLGAGAAFTGALQSAYGLAQVVGASLFGGLSDRLGRKAVLVVSLLGAIAGYSTIAAAVMTLAHPGWLLMSRIPIGLTKQTVAVSRAAVADCTSHDSRAQALGVLAASAGIGFVIGPATGGILGATTSPATPPLVAVGFFVLSLAIVWWRVPETAAEALVKSRISAEMASVARTLEACAFARAISAVAQSLPAGSPSTSIDTDLVKPLEGQDGLLLHRESAFLVARDGLRRVVEADVTLSHEEMQVLSSMLETLLDDRASADGLVAVDDCVTSVRTLCCEVLEAQKVISPASKANLSAHAVRAGKRQPDECADTRPYSAWKAQLRQICAAVLRHPRLRHLAVIRLCVEIAVMLVHTTFPTYAQVRRPRPSSRRPLATGSAHVPARRPPVTQGIACSLHQAHGVHHDLCRGHERLLRFHRAPEIAAEAIPDPQDFGCRGHRRRRPYAAVERNLACASRHHAEPGDRLGGGLLAPDVPQHHDGECCGHRGGGDDERSNRRHRVAESRSGPAPRRRPNGAEWALGARSLRCRALRTGARRNAHGRPLTRASVQGHAGLVARIQVLGEVNSAVRTPGPWSTQLGF